MVPNSDGATIGGHAMPAGAAPLNRDYSLGLHTNPLDLALFGVGALINLFAYSSLEPILVACIFYMTGLGLLFLSKAGGLYEYRIFIRVFAVGFLMVGVAAIYLEYFNDAEQLYLDAGSFFYMASSGAAGMPLDELHEIHEGSLAIVIWRATYDFFAALGFSRERYVGALINVVAVAFTGVLAIKMARLVYGEDPYRFKRLTLLFAACGLFWLFEGVHLRDSVVLLAVTALALAWTHFLAEPGLGLQLLQVSISSIFAAFYFWYLRVEFVFVPIAMGLAGVAAMVVGSRAKRFVAYFVALACFLAATGLIISFGEDILHTLLWGQEAYHDGALDQHSADSLGMALIVNQMAPIRLLLGSLYLFVYPIPVWLGFQLESVYQLLKAVNALFFYFVMPLLALAVWNLWLHKNQRTTTILFLLFTTAGFTLAIAGTSLETRHFGAFLTPIFILALLPDLRIPTVRSSYRQLLIVMLSSVVVVHVAWAVLKFVL